MDGIVALVRSGCTWLLLRSMELRGAGCWQRAAVPGRVVHGRYHDRWIPGGGLQAAGRGVGIGMCMALVAIVALAWLLLWVGIGWFPMSVAVAAYNRDHRY